MTTGNEQLGKLNCSGKEHEREGDQQKSAAIAKAEGEAGEGKNRKVLELMRDASLRAQPSRNEGQHRDRDNPKPAGGSRSRLHNDLRLLAAQQQSGMHR